MSRVFKTFDFSHGKNRFIFLSALKDTRLFVTMEEARMRRRGRGRTLQINFGMERTRIESDCFPGRKGEKCGMNKTRQDSNDAGTFWRQWNGIWNFFLHRWCVIPRIVCHCVWSIYGAMFGSPPDFNLFIPLIFFEQCKTKQSKPYQKKQPRKFDWADRVTKAYMHEHNERVNQCHLHQMLAQPHSTSEERQFFSILFYFILFIECVCYAVLFSTLSLIVSVVCSLWLSFAWWYKHTHGFT